MVNTAEHSAFFQKQAADGKIVVKGSILPAVACETSIDQTLKIHQNSILKRISPITKVRIHSNAFPTASSSFNPLITGVMKAGPVWTG